MKQLIINADDFGLTQHINQGVIKAYQEGILTSTSLMVNMPGSEDALGLLKQNPGIGVGIHLNIFIGKSLAPQSRLGSFTKNGYFLQDIYRLLWILISKRINSGELELECRMQIEKALNSGVSITHLDSHMHLHFLGEFRALIMKLAQEYKIMRVRCINELPLLCGKNYRFLRFLRRKYYNALFLSVCSRASKALANKQGLKTTDYSYGVSESGIITEQKYRNAFSCLRDGVTEIICHPGYEDREVELDVLLRPGLKDLLHKLDVKLISYNGF